MNVADVNALFKKLPLALIQTMSKPIGVEEPQDKNPSTLADLLKGSISIGVRTIGLQMKVEFLKDLSTDLKLEGTTRNAVVKQLVAKIAEQGLDKTFKSVKKEHLEGILDALDIEDKESSQSALVTQVVEELRAVGIEMLLNKQKWETLQQIAEHLKIEVPLGTSRPILVEAIIDGELPEKRTRTPPAKVTKKKPDLVKGVNAESIVAHYGKPELQEYAEKNKLNVPPSAKKREFASKIVAFLDGEKEDGKKEKPKKADKKESKPAEEKGDKKEAKTQKGRKGKGATTKGDKKKDAKEDEDATATNGDDKKENKKEEEKEKEKEEAPKRSTRKSSPEKGKRKAEDEAPAKSPEKKKPKKASTSSEEKPLKDTIFTIVGKFENKTHAAIERDIKKLGGKVQSDVDDKTTHLLVPDTSATNAKITKAKENASTKIVGIDFINSKLPSK